MIQLIDFTMVASDPITGFAAHWMARITGYKTLGLEVFGVPIPEELQIGG